MDINYAAMDKTYAGMDKYYAVMDRKIFTKNQTATYNLRWYRQTYAAMDTIFFTKLCRFSLKYLAVSRIIYIFAASNS